MKWPVVGLGYTRILVLNVYVTVLRMISQASYTANGSNMLSFRYAGERVAPSTDVSTKLLSVGKRSTICTGQGRSTQDKYPSLSVLKTNARLELISGSVPQTLPVKANPPSE